MTLFVRLGKHICVDKVDRGSFRVRCWEGLSEKRWLLKKLDHHAFFLAGRNEYW